MLLQYDLLPRRLWCISLFSDQFSLTSLKKTRIQKLHHWESFKNAYKYQVELWSKGWFLPWKMVGTKYKRRSTIHNELYKPYSTNSSKIGSELMCNGNNSHFMPDTKLNVEFGKIGTIYFNYRGRVFTLKAYTPWRLIRLL